MPRKQTTAAASHDAVLRRAQGLLKEPAARVDFAKSAKSHEHCTQAIRAVEDAGLHKSADPAIRQEARSTLCLAYRCRALTHNMIAGGDRKQELPDALAALDMASCTDDAIVAQLVHVIALMNAKQFPELRTACDRLEETLQLPREAAKLRFMTLEVKTDLCGAMIVRARRMLQWEGFKVRVDEADGFHLGGQHERAIASYSETLEAIQAAGSDAKGPELKARAFAGIARSHAALGRHQAAAAAAKLAVKHQPEHLELHLLHGQTLLLAGSHRAAGLAFMRGCLHHRERNDDFLKGIHAVNDAAGSSLFSDEDIARTLPLASCKVCRVSQHDRLRMCGKCYQVWYCCAEHQRADWRNHKRACATFASMPTEWHKPAGQNELSSIVAAMCERGTPPKRGPKLAEFSTWEAFAKLVPPKAPLSARGTLILHQALSFPLTLAAALVAFELDKRSSLCVHIVNIGHEDRRIFETSGMFMHRLPFPAMELLFCGLCSSAHDLIDGAATLAELMSGRNKVTARTAWGVWHENARDLPPPDLVVGFNTDLHAVAYEWPVTLRALVARNVPCVFTAANEAEYERALVAVRTASASLAFHGRGPFPSPQPDCRLGELQYLNSFWVAFCGGLA